GSKQACVRGQADALQIAGRVPSRKGVVAVEQFPVHHLAMTHTLIKRTRRPWLNAYVNEIAKHGVFEILGVQPSQLGGWLLGRIVRRSRLALLGGVLSHEQIALNRLAFLARMNADPVNRRSWRSCTAQQKCPKSDGQQRIQQQRHQYQREDRSAIAENLAEFLACQSAQQTYMGRQEGSPHDWMSSLILRDFGVVVFKAGTVPASLRNISTSVWQPVAARNSVSVPELTSRPRCSRPKRSHRRSASSSWCVVSNTALPSERTWAMNSATTWLPSTSSPAVGSSSSSTGGR